MPTPTSLPVAPAPLVHIRLALAFPSLPPGAFGSRPLLLTYPPDGTDRVTVAEQSGKVYMLRNDPSVREVALFLDISGKVSTQGNEEGLPGLAFDPGYARTGAFYVYYSAASPRRSVLSRFTVRAGDPNAADASSEQVVLEVPQPFSNHNGGALAFGPDGYLYVGLGDGGSAGDPQSNGQSLRTLLGKVLRIDVRVPDRPYAVPQDNPYVGPQAPSGARGEIWAYGLRNPWRFSFDRATGDLWVGDVGQNRREEIDLVRKGGNYGWNIMEGGDCFSPASGCNRAGLLAPVTTYSHDLGCSVTGGYVYRGAAHPALRGAYLYADFCSGAIWGLRYDGSEVTDHRLLLDTPLAIASFGEDAAGELYITAFDGHVYRVQDDR